MAAAQLVINIAVVVVQYVTVQNYALHKGANALESFCQQSLLKSTVAFEINFPVCTQLYNRRLRNTLSLTLLCHFRLFTLISPSVPLLPSSELVSAVRQIFQRFCPVCTRTECIVMTDEATVNSSYSMSPKSDA